MKRTEIDWPAVAGSIAVLTVMGLMWWAVTHV